MKNISVSWASGVENEEAVHCLAAVVGVITSFYYSRWPWGLIAPIVGLRPFGNWVIPALPEGHPYSSFDWYVDAAFDQSWQALDAERFLDLVVQEPWQHAEHHYDFSLVHVPVRRGDSTDHLAMAARLGTAAVISADWARFYDTVQAQRLTLRRMAYQGIGLAFGLRPHVDQAVPCAMRLARDHGAFLDHTVEEHRAGTVYCDEHQRDLLSILLSGRGPLN